MSDEPEFRYYAIRGDRKAGVYRSEDGRVNVVRENLDECVLCELCLDAAPDGAVVVKKLYDGTQLRR